MKGHLERYLAGLSALRSTGSASPETSYYGVLSELFDGVGRELTPQVRIVLTPKNMGKGHPDGLLYTANQWRRKSDQAPPESVLPERGAVEVKGTADDVWKIADTPQVDKYLDLFNQVLVTNYRDFLLVEYDAQGKKRLGESYRLSRTEQEFWVRALAPGRAEQETGQHFVEYLKRVMLRPAPISTPEDLATLLAAYAREGLIRVVNTPEDRLSAFRQSLEESLGFRFDGKHGEHLFRSTFVQTLFYGIFAAWVVAAREGSTPKGKFEWRTAQWDLLLPAIQAMFTEIATPKLTKETGLGEVLDWTADALNRVQPARFFEKFQQRHAIQYFYEPFLAAFDPELKKDLGVWYTPPEVVEYMVHKVDMALRNELGLADGLADPRVRVLDPAVGTGSFLLAVLERIRMTLEEKGDGALVGHDLREAATRRVFGFEIMPAPFVVSHMQLGLLLRNAGAPVDMSKGERIGVYLTNSLTGWTEDKAQKPFAAFSELLAERKAADRIKQTDEILVVLGNPPYNAFKGTNPIHKDDGMLAPYKKGLKEEWGVTKNTLNDLYVRFFRLAERRVAELNEKKQGIVCYISNFSYLSGEAFTVMRRHFLESFDEIWIDNLNGDSRETSKKTPTGEQDPSIFSTLASDGVGIQKGIAIGLLLKRGPKHNGHATVHYRDFWGKNKASELHSIAMGASQGPNYEPILPAHENRFLFKPWTSSDDYQSWPQVTELAAIPPLSGPVEGRAGALISIDREPLVKRVRAYLDLSVADQDVAELHASMLMVGNGIVGPQDRKKIAGRINFSETKIRRYQFKPWDFRLCYLDAGLHPLFSRPSPELIDLADDNQFFITRDAADKFPEGIPALMSTNISERDTISGHARHFPFLIKRGEQWVNETTGKIQKQAKLLNAKSSDLPEMMANLSPSVRHYLRDSGIEGDEREIARIVWTHALATCFSPAYLSENRDALAHDWPRIPLPKDSTALLDSARLGTVLAALLDVAPVSGVSTGKLRPELTTLGNIARDAGGQVDPGAGDLEVNAGWGAGKEKVMPGKGRVVFRAYTTIELETFESGGIALGIPAGELISLLGEQTSDIYLNETVAWRNVPVGVWGFVLGGYQVLKKWLSYREATILGRALKVEEAREFRDMVRRVAAILILQPQLDANYARASTATVPNPGKSGGENRP